MSFYSLFNMTDAEYQALTATELQLTGSTYVNLETFSGDAQDQNNNSNSANELIFFFKSN